MRLSNHLKLLNLFKLIWLISAFSILVSAQKLEDNQFLLNVGVTDYERNIVKSLKKENFRLSENNKPVEISYFSNEDVPMSAGFLIDVSQSMGSGINICREAAINFIEKSNPANEYFTMAFDNKVTLVSDFSNKDDTEKVISQNPRFIEKPKPGETLLYQAMELGIENFAKAKNQKKILLVFLDMGDSYNTDSFDKIKNIVKKENVPLYFVACNYSSNAFILDVKFRTLSEISGGKIINSGGGLYRIISKEFYDDKDFFSGQFSELAEQIRNQYTLGFSIVGDNSNKWRKLKVKIETEKELKKKLTNTFTTHREGYYPNVTENSGS